MRTSDYKRKGVIELKIRKNRNVNPRCMMHYFVAAAFLLFLFAFWYLSDSVRALEGDMNTQMKYTTQSTADYVYYRLNRVAFSADALKTSVSPIMYETNDPYEEYREIRNALMTTLDDKVLSYCRIYFTQDKLYADQFTNKWMLGKIEGLEQDMPENGWTYSFWGTPHEENYGITIGSRLVMSYYCPVRSQTDFNQVDGVIVMDLDVAEIEKMLLREGSDTLYLIDEHGQILVSTDGTGIGEELLKEPTVSELQNESENGSLSVGHTRYVYSRLQDTHWYLVGRIENSDIYKLYCKILAVGAFVAVILLCVVASLLLGIKNANLKYHVSEISLQSAQYQMQAMQAQIKPHFMYNILDSIKWMILDEKTQESARMLNELSRFLRLSFGKGTGIVTMAQELECLNAYVKLMQDRYDGAFTYNVDVEEDTLDNQIPKFTLQPLVENALLHGLLHCEKKDKCIMVRSWMDENAWYIEIEDNGMGMTQEEADLILENENDVQADNYGIYNIRGRLRIFSENRCHMRVISRPGIGTCVCIEITKRKEK